MDVCYVVPRIPDTTVGKKSKLNMAFGNAGNSAPIVWRPNVISTFGTLGNRRIY